MTATTATIPADLHISREYEDGYGHIEACEGRLLVSFCPTARKRNRLTQVFVGTLEQARWTLRKLANG